MSAQHKPGETVRPAPAKGNDICLSAPLDLTNEDVIAYLFSLYKNQIVKGKNRGVTEKLCA